MSEAAALWLTLVIKQGKFHTEAYKVSHNHYILW